MTQSQQAAKRSYSSRARGLGALAREARQLRRAHTQDLPGRVQSAVHDLAQIEQLVRDQYGVELNGLDVLDVGCGQLVTQLSYFGRRNRSVGIDLDVIVEGFDVSGYVRMTRSNGVVRALKVVGRKVFGIDAAWQRELARTLEVDALPDRKILQMDAGQMLFPDESFDFAYSIAVINHVPDPYRVLSEMVRVLRPGGVAYVAFPLYTSATGSLDPRLLAGDPSTIPPWAHLRPGVRHLVVEGAYLNRLRLDEWKQLFEELMPGSQFEGKEKKRAAYEPEAIRLQTEGELVDYSVDELLTSDCFVTWQKPA